MVVLMLMQSPTGSLALATPVRFCMLLWPALLAGWPINSLHGWAAYQALMVTGHLTALDKTPESSPLTLGTLGIRYLPSLFLKLLVLRTALRHVELIYFVLAYSIEAATAPHATCLQHAWNVNHASNLSRFLLIDPYNNPFNEELNCTIVMLVV